MDNQLKPHGVMAALATPWRDGGLDVAGLERLVARVVSGGAHGISPAGSTGEGALLTPAQRAELTRRVRALTPPGMPVITGMPVRTEPEARAELDDLAAAGADAALVAPPSYYPLADDGVLRLYLSLADSSPLPIVLYNIPVFTKVRLSPEVVASLAAHPNVIGIKDSSRDMEYQQEVIIATAGADFAVLTGSDTLLTGTLALGGTGTIAASVNLVPGLVRAIYDGVTSGGRAEAVLAQRRLARIVAACRDGYFPAGWKAALELAGVCTRVPVSPGVAMSEEACQRLRAALIAAGMELR